MSGDNLRSDAILLSNSLLIVNVYLGERNALWFRVFCRETFVERGYLLARSTPICEDYPYRLAFLNILGQEQGCSYSL
jgi:hypothetical protein